MTSNVLMKALVLVIKSASYVAFAILLLHENKAVEFGFKTYKLREAVSVCSLSKIASAA